MFKWLVRKCMCRLARELDCVRNDTRDIAFCARGTGVRISQGTRFVVPEGIRIGDYVYIGPHCFFSGSGQLTIGDNTAIGPHVYVYTSNHNFDEPQFVPFDAKLDNRPVVIGSHVWVGGNVVIVPGVTVHEGAVIAAGSVVTTDVPRCAVVAGNPARVIRTRNVERFDKLVAEGKWYERYEVQQNESR